MFQKLSSSIQDSNRNLLLAAGLFLASSAPSAEAQQALTVPSIGKSVAGDKKPEIPENILAEARLKHIDASSIKQINGKWIACTTIPGLPDSCIELGASDKKPSQRAEVVTVLNGLKNGDVLQVNRYGKSTEELTISLATNVVGSSSPGTGKFSRQKNGTISFALEQGVEARVSVKGGSKNQLIDTLPEYVKESDMLIRTKNMDLVKSYLASHPDENFLVIVTVPAECPPCRQLDSVVSQYFKDRETKESRVKTFILEFFDFDTAKSQALGKHGIFPTLLAFRGGEAPNGTLPRIIGQTGGVSAQELAEPVREHLPSKGYPNLLIRGGVLRDGLAKIFQQIKP